MQALHIADPDALYEFDFYDYYSGGWGWVTLDDVKIRFDLVLLPDNRLIKRGSGTVTVSGDNTYHGETAIESGIFVASSDTALDAITAGTVIADGATLKLPDEKVTAYCDHLVISNYISESHVPCEAIEEIEGYRWQSAVFLKLRLRTDCRFGCTIHFLLPSTFDAIESQPEFQLLREKCPRLCKQTHNWWFGSVQLKPPDCRQ